MPDSEVNVATCRNVSSIFCSSGVRWRFGGRKIRPIAEIFTFITKIAKKCCKNSKNHQKNLGLDPSFFAKMTSFGRFRGHRPQYFGKCCDMLRHVALAARFVGKCRDMSSTRPHRDFRQMSKRLSRHPRSGQLFRMVLAPSCCRLHNWSRHPRCQRFEAGPPGPHPVFLFLFCFLPPARPL